MNNEVLLDLFRGEKVSYHTVKGHTNLIHPCYYPFSKNEVPLQCIPLENELSTFRAFSSGIRSIVQLLDGHQYLKAKAIGIPTGNSKLYYTDGSIYSYFLFDDTIIDFVIWGLATISEAKLEFERSVEARDLALPAPTMIGLGYYENVRVLDVENQRALFTLLQTMNLSELLNQFTTSSRDVDAACIFMVQPTDVRVDEILYGFLHPKIYQTNSFDDIKAFLKWLGSSCGKNLRAHHDENILHGTELKEGILLSNSHTANHLVDENGTYMTDYSRKSENVDRLKRAELFCLASLMNPLPKAEMAAKRIFQSELSSPSSTSMQSHEGYSELFLGSGLEFLNYLDKTTSRFRPNNLKETCTRTFLEGMRFGYDKAKTFSVEAKIRRKLLTQTAIMKKELFQLLGLPRDFLRGSAYVKELMKHHPNLSS
ncbi:MAG: hypothetical protein JSV76_02785 [Candidatus Bathyarchaeota archaeon]|nr:MAG: hypothetical protein JSV76_02785 [Candidatus Bathyarchaeota archaeon]